MSITDYLLNNRLRLIEETQLERDEYYRALVDVDSLFHDHLKMQYRIKILQKICDDVCKNLAISYEEVYLVVEEVDLQELLNG